MTTELEQEFFEVFEIEPIPIKSYGYWLIKGSIAENDKGEKVVYPKITGDMLLQLIVIRATNYKNGTVIELEPDSNIEDLKYEVLTHFINYRGSFDKHQIQQLFKEEE